MVITRHSDTVYPKIIAQQLIQLRITCAHRLAGRECTVDCLCIVRICCICHRIICRLIIHFITDQLMDLQLGIIDRTGRIDLMLHRSHFRKYLLRRTRTGAA